MNESTKFMVKNIRDTYEIWKAIPLMQKETLSGVDKAIRDACQNWLGADWQVHENTLQSDNEVSVTNTNFIIKSEGKEVEAYIWLCIQIDGKDAIWKFFGLPTDNKDDGVYIRLWFYTDSLKNRKGAVAEIDNILKPLEKFDFYRIGGINNSRYETEVTFTTDAILKGLENDDWDQAIDIVKQKWQQIANSVDWDRLKKTIQKYVE